MSIEESLRLIGQLLLLTGVILLLTGWQRISSARRLPYFLLRRELSGKGWRSIGFGLLSGVFALMLLLFGTRVAYVIVPPTPSLTPTATNTLTPTTTLSPTISATPTISTTPTITSTATATSTPFLPQQIILLYRETVTPRPDAALSPILVSTRIDRNNQAINPRQEFENPLRRLYGAFTYNNLADGVRWTAIWYYGEEEVCLEATQWDGGTGGFGYTECEPDYWLPGEYEIQMFVGDRWVVSTRFTVIGDPPTPTPTLTRTATSSMTPTATLTPTLALSSTQSP